MNRGCLFGSIRYSIAGSLTARRASSAGTQPIVSSAYCMVDVQSYEVLHLCQLSGSRQFSLDNTESAIIERSRTSRHSCVLTKRTIRTQVRLLSCRVKSILKAQAFT